MKHYTREEWLDYKKGLTDKKHIMERHLRNCEQCKNLFLTLINESELCEADSIIPAGFSTATMRYIENKQVVQKSLRHGRNQQRKLLGYYAIAAAITLMLVNQGFFQLAVKEVSRVPTTHTAQRVDVSKSLIFNWPMKLTQKSSDLTHIIPKRINLKEVIR